MQFMSAVLGFATLMNCDLEDKVSGMVEAYINKENKVMALSKVPATLYGSKVSDQHKDKAAQPIETSVFKNKK